MAEEKDKDVENLESTETSTTSDLQIENNALKELLAENKKTMDALNNELKSVKTTNAKLLNQLSVEKEKPSVESLLNDNFNKYVKKGK